MDSVLCVKNFLMVFDQIMALTKGGPAQSTESISYLIYNNGMSGGQFGFQGARQVHVSLKPKYNGWTPSL